MHYTTDEFGGGKLKLNTESIKPIYIQISDWLENEILLKNIKSNEKMYSQYQLAEIFNVNPATAAKGLGKLLSDNIVYKKRGLGMFLSDEGREIILDKRKNEVLKKMIYDLVKEAKILNVDIDELIFMVKSAKNNELQEENNESNSM